MRAHARLDKSTSWMGHLSTIAIAEMSAGKWMGAAEAVVSDSTALPIITIVLIYHPKRGLA